MTLGEITAFVQRELACISAKALDPENYRGKPMDNVLNDYLARLRVQVSQTKGR